MFILLAKTLTPSDFITEIVGGIIATLFLSTFQLLKKYYKKKKLSKDLHPFYSANEIEKSVKYYVPVKCQNVPPSKELELSQSTGISIKSLLMKFFIGTAFAKENIEQRFYIILADAGLGKTTFMINLYYKYTYKFNRKYDIALFPLGHPKTMEKLMGYDEEKAKSTILLLDGFDEDRAAMEDHVGRLNEIVDTVWMFRQVVISCRTQFFANQEKEPFEIHIPKAGIDTGFHKFHKVYISPFDDGDIEKYFKKRFGAFKRKEKDKAREIIKNSKNLMVRPMLLANINELLEEKEIDFELSYDIYDFMVKKWIKRDADRIEIKKRSIFIEEMNLLLDGLVKKVHKTGYFIEEYKIEEVLTELNLGLTKSEVKSKSLLNRNHEGFYKFSHASIFEFCLAKAAFKDSQFAEEIDFENYSEAKRFYEEIEYRNKILPFFNQDSGNITTINEKGDVVPVMEFLKTKKMDSVTTIFFKKVKELNFNFIARLTGLSSLQAANSEIKSYNKIEKIKRLKTINLINCKIENLDPIKSLHELDELHITNGTISDLSPIRGLHNLCRITLADNNISDLEPLSELHYLERLFIESNQINDLSPLYKLRRLKHIWIYGNPISDDKIEEARCIMDICGIYTEKSLIIPQEVNSN